MDCRLRSPLDDPTLGFKEFPELLAVVALDLDAILDDLAPGGAGLFELTCEILEKGLVPRQALDDGDGLPPPAGLFNPETGGDPVRNRFIEGGGAATLLCRPAAGRTDPSRIS